jgi:NADPH:quinone reductase-like Zn-dependent oxidoreductase
VRLAYLPDAMGKMLKRGMGWSFPSEQLGARIMREIIALVLAKKVKPVIGRVVEFQDIPAAIEAMANRQTVGRTIVML